MITSIVPKFLFEAEDIVTLKENNIKFQEGFQAIGKFKVPCYKFFNLTETQVFDEIEKENLCEATDYSNREIATYSSRVSALLFMQIRAAARIKDKDLKISAACSLLSSANALAAVNIRLASRFVPLIRTLM